MLKVSEQRIREAAEELVNYRWGNATVSQASAAGTDMREWQLGGSRLVKAAKSAVDEVKGKQDSKPENHPQKVQESYQKTQAELIEQIFQKKHDDYFLKQTDPEYHKQKIAEATAKLNKDRELAARNVSRNYHDRLSTRQEERLKKEIKDSQKKLKVIEEWHSQGGIGSGKVPGILFGIGKPSLDAIAIAQQRQQQYVPSSNNIAQQAIEKSKIAKDLKARI